METNVNYTVVGTFVITLTALIIFGIIWLCSGLSFQTYSTYQVYMKESVSGLNIDAPVLYNGVNVGTVSDVEIDKKNPHLVSLLLKIKSDTPITEGTRAKLNVRSLSGIAYMELEDKGTNMNRLRALRGQPYPVIATTPSLFLQLDAALKQLSDSFRQVADSMSKLLDKDNLRSIKTLLQSSVNVMQLLQTQTLPATNQAMNNLDALTLNLSRISAEIAQNPAVLIRGKTPVAPGPGEQQ
ncbi:MAG TPA: MlaD family protein [Gammaproteobacteria bacterium]|nr:MlaD family protein [Gammaproteobacteria bacterium]